MNRLNRWQYFLAVVVGLIFMSGCAAELARRPTLGEARAGQRPQEGDTTLRPGEVQAEVAEIDPPRREIRVIEMNTGRRNIIPYDPAYTRVSYHGFDYPADALEAGDVIAFAPPPWSPPYVDTVRVQLPVQARAASTFARAPLPPPRPEVIEGTVERIDYDRGVFDIRPRTSGRMITVTLPYNARGAEIDNFRRLRRGDYVRVEGDYVNADNLQLVAFR
ncbi:MAG TPA: hypothetical protein VGL11_20740 [Candidatus Binatia bacterium]|jgi:hypothetical protein